MFMVNLKAVFSNFIEGSSLTAWKPLFVVAIAAVELLDF